MAFNLVPESFIVGPVTQNVVPALWIVPINVVSNFSWLRVRGNYDSGSLHVNNDFMLPPTKLLLKNINYYFNIVVNNLWKMNKVRLHLKINNASNYFLKTAHLYYSATVKNILNVLTIRTCKITNTFSSLVWIQNRPSAHWSDTYHP